MALLDPQGRAIPSDVISRIRNGSGRPQASLSGSAPAFFPYDAAQWSSTEMGDWLPWIRSPDTEINLYRDRMVARARDLYRNDGWVFGAVGRILDSTIGGYYRLIANPNWRSLARRFGPSFDRQWASEFRHAAEALWDDYSEDVGRYNDYSRELTVSQQFRLLLGHHLVDGESLAAIYWDEDRVGPTSTDFATSFQVIDPDRLSNPYLHVDTRYLRGGVELDDRGAPVAYHIRRAEPNDFYNTLQSMEWERVEKEDDDGWRRCIHSFDRHRAGQHRGVSVFAPVLSRLKMLATYYGVELQAATVASVFGTYITSPFDGQMVEEAMTPRGGRQNGLMDGFLGEYMDFQEAYHDVRGHPMLNSVRMPTLAPGEDIKTVAAERPNGSFSPFAHEMLRSVAAVLGTSAEQVTQDYSEVNYSSARVGIVESEKMYRRRLSDFNANVARPFYASWLWEAMERGLLPLPRNAPPFAEAKNSYSRCRWLGAARGWVDPVSERQGAVLGLDAAFDTLENQCAMQGMDWEENLEQRAREVKRFKELGLPLPDWGGVEISASKASDPPTKPEAK